jgi:hypothetical protein
MKKFIYPLISLTLLLFVCCTNDNDGTNENLPQITNEGKNTFGCKVNGEIFLPKSKGGFSLGFRPPILTARYFYLQYNYYGLEPGHYLQILAYNELTTKSINIQLTKSDVPLVQGQTYPIVLKGNGFFDAEFSYSTTSPDPNYNNVFIYNSFEYKTTNEYFGVLTINKIDTTNLIISGTFSFDCYNTIDDKTSQIREGRFDIKYAPYPN